VEGTADSGIEMPFDAEVNLTQMVRLIAGICTVPNSGTGSMMSGKIAISGSGMGAISVWAYQLATVRLGERVRRVRKIFHPMQLLPAILHKSENGGYHRHVSHLCCDYPGGAMLFDNWIVPIRPISKESSASCQKMKNVRHLKPDVVNLEE
jgi:hypothetical protein